MCSGAWRRLWPENLSGLKDQLKYQNNLKISELLQWQSICQTKKPKIDHLFDVVVKDTFLRLNLCSLTFKYQKKGPFCTWKSAFRYIHCFRSWVAHKMFCCKRADRKVFLGWTNWYSGFSVVMETCGLKKLHKTSFMQLELSQKTDTFFLNFSKAPHATKYFKSKWKMINFRCLIRV